MSGLRACGRPLTEEYDLALVDLDGVVYTGSHAIEHAATSLMRAMSQGTRLVYVTNNASRTPQSVAEQLIGVGLQAAARDVMTSAQAAAALLRTRLDPGERVLVIGAHGLHQAVQDVGLHIVDSAHDNPVAVVQGFGPEVGWTQLAEAAFAIHAGAWHVATNLDMSIPVARGIAPGNGSLVRAVHAATGVEPDSAGKPSPTMYDLAVQRAGASNALVIGDRLDTDLAGARAGGYAGLHVLTGVNTARDVILAEPGERPHYLGVDLRALHHAHPVPAMDAGWWVCGAAAARVIDARLEVSETDRTIDSVRVAAHAVWSVRDAGGTVDPSSVPQITVE